MEGELMKHLICLCMSCVMLLALSGCGQKETDVTIEPTVSTEAAAEEETVAAPTETQIMNPTEESIPAVTEHQEPPIEAPTEENQETEEPEHKHNYTSKVTQTPTCTNSGVITYTCKECGDTYSQNLEPLDHAFVVTKKPADCVNSGGTTHRCTACGFSYTDDILPALGHSFGPLVTVKNPTELLPGLAEHKCSRCGEIEKVELPKLTSES